MRLLVRARSDRGGPALRRERCGTVRRRAPTTGPESDVPESPTARHQPDTPCGPGSGGGFDELEVELDLDHVAEHRAERAEAQIEVLAADLAGGLEAGVAGAVEERLDTAELDVELDRTSDLADCELAVEYPASADDRSSRSPKCTRSARFANLAR